MSNWDKLSPSERRVMVCTAKGYTITNTAYMLGISESTVGKVRHNIFQKLKVNTILEAILKLYTLAPIGQIYSTPDPENMLSDATSSNKVAISKENAATS